MMENTEQIQLTIRCAMQSFSDYNVECPGDWSVLQLKEHLSLVCASNPEVSRQRLIYAGHCLENGQKISEVLNQRRDGISRDQPLEKQVIHMVYIGGSKEADTAPASSRSAGIRYRGSANATPPLNNAPTLSAGYFGHLNADNNNMQNGTNYASVLGPTQQPQYEAYLAAYQNYVNQMMQFYQHNAQFIPVNNGWQQNPFVQHNQDYFTGMVPNIANGQMVFGTPVPIIQQQHFLQPPLGNNNGVVANENNGDLMAAADGGQQGAPDFLDIVYKSIRFALLAMVLYMYSSFERFFFVFVLVAFFWFVHARRRRQNQQQNGVEPQNDQRYNAVNGEAAPFVAVQPNNNNNSPWNIFFTVVQSFFTSLIPNPAPAPLDVN